MKQIPIIIILSTLFLFTKAQYNISQECGTPEMDSASFFSQPHITDPNFLDNFRITLDSHFNKEKGGNTKSIDTDVYYNIPIHFWLYESDNWSNVDALTIAGWLNDLNEVHRNSNTKMRFRLSCEGYTRKKVDDDKLERNAGGMLLLTSGDNYTGAINIYVVRDYSGPKVSGAYNTVNGKISIDHNINSTTLVHEIGHYFGLAHFPRW